MPGLGVKMNSSHTHSDTFLPVLFTISDDHPHHFYMEVDPPGVLIHIPFTQAGPGKENMLSRFRNITRHVLAVAPNVAAIVYLLLKPAPKKFIGLKRNKRNFSIFNTRY